MGIAGALGLFGSIILHELSHSMVARRYGMPMKGITLFIFGGVAEMEDEPPHARAEFLVAIAGPIASILIAAACWGLSLAGKAAHWSTSLVGVLAYLGWINAILVAFNALPAYPLDGGRVLRSALWKWKGNLRRATCIASEVGAGFGLALIILGFLSVLGGAIVGGVWWILIGLFLRSAARMSYQQLVIRRALEGEPVRRFMKTEPKTAPPDATIKELVEDYMYRHHFKLFPVTRYGVLLGCVSTRQVKETPQSDWPSRTVQEIAEPCSSENTIGADEDALRALSKMRKADASRLMVVQDGNLAGILTLKDLLKFIALKIELEDEEEVPQPALEAMAQ
jgi:Zn-dependent protease